MLNKEIVKILTQLEGEVDEEFEERINNFTNSNDGWKLRCASQDGRGYCTVYIVKEIIV